MLTREIIQKIPKVELHDHLDGGLRIPTILEFATQYGVKLPFYEERALHDWFVRGCQQKSLTLYLQTFAVTVAVMQTAEALERVAFEAIEDLHEHNVCYAEIRFAPNLHLEQGLTAGDAVQAVLDGMERGRKKTGMQTGLILCAMRNQSPELSLATAELAVAFRNRGVVGFDLAGDESGHPPKIHLQAFQYIRNQNFNITIHAGEAFGVESIWQAVQVCGAHRIGHGTRLVEDMTLEGTHIKDSASLATFIRNKRIPMEMCLTSNVGTGVAPDYARHPFPMFFRNQFRVFLCTDNRLMSDTNLTREMEIAAQYYNLTFRDLEKLTINAMKSAFINHDKKLDLIYTVIKKGYQQIRTEYGILD